MKRSIILLIAGAAMSQMAFAQGWEFQVSPTVNRLNSVIFVDYSNGWAVGDSGTIIHTTDGGSIWTAQTSGTMENLRAVDFVDSDHGWAVGGSRTVCHTTDGGVTWQTQDSTEGSELWSVSFADADHGWAVGGFRDNDHHGFVRATTDGGTTWTTQSSPSSGYLRAVNFVDLTQGWAVGDSGTILKYNPTPSIAREPNAMQPSSLNLSCYPNPFNATTTLDYDLPKAGHISLRVFDVLGRKVEELKDGFV
jgi:hypothetical protein